MRVTAEAARRFLVARHLLAPARTCNGGEEAVLEVFRRLGSIQFDPIAVAGRSHDLVLHARVADYEPSLCDALYARRKIFEAHNKGLSLVPAADYPWFRGTWSRQAKRVLEENSEVAAQVLDRFRAEGPLSVADFERTKGQTTDWFGLPTNAVRAVPLAEQLRHKMLSRYRAHGLLGTSGGGDIFGGLGPAKPDPGAPGYPGRTNVREALIAEGELVAVDVEGVRGKRFVLREEAGLLEAPPEPAATVAFLPPFDALVWDRPLLSSLFDFDYVWDLFHPPGKRRFCWYLQPLLFGDPIVGRIEQRIYPESGRVERKPPASRSKAAT